jgi:hypothetical protein
VHDSGARIKHVCRESSLPYTEAFHKSRSIAPCVMSHHECEPEPEPETTAVAAPPAAPAGTPLAPRLQRQLELQQSPPIRITPLLLGQLPSRYTIKVPDGLKVLDSVAMSALIDRFRKMAAFTKLRGRYNVSSYVERFGLLTREHPFGNFLWYGIHEAAVEWRNAYTTRPTDNLLRDSEPAWFYPPEEWCDAARKKALPIGEARSNPHAYADGKYPTLVRENTTGFVETIVEINCFHVVEGIGRHSHHSCCVHQTRISYDF